MIKIDADVAVLGSGFGGCLCALILDRIGLRPLVVDRAAHPRFAIGESSTPLADMILRDLAERYDLPRLTPLAAYGPWKAHYPHLGVGLKRGFSYFYHQSEEPFQPDPEHGNELLVAASAGDFYSDTHWLRADVDAFFAEEVRHAGIPFLENTAVGVLAHEPGWVLEGKKQDVPVTVHTRFVIDATGAGGVLPRALKLVDTIYPFRTHSRALFSHFDGVRPWRDLMADPSGGISDHPFPCDAAALHHVFDGGWMWMLRFDNNVVSAGFVLDPRHHPVDPSLPPEMEWQGWLARFPSLQEQFALARIVHPPGALVRTGRLQRRVTRAAGANWALLPYTAGFIDPLHSTGIAHTLSGIERLMALLTRHWGEPTLEEALTGYSASVLRELALIDGLVAACYEASGSFRLYTASAMLYFAAVVTYEQQRLQKAHEHTKRLFLGADDEDFSRIIAEALDRLSSLQRDRSLHVDAVHAFEAYVEEAIVPYNTVGLFHPVRPNMYHHTAARR